MVHVRSIKSTLTFVLLPKYNVDEAGLPVDEREISLFEESSNGSGISYFDDLDHPELLCHNDVPFDGQCDSDMINIRVESSDDLSDLDSN